MSNSKTKMIKYMVVEHFKPGCSDEMFQQYNEAGRSLPDGLFYLHSWINREKSICFQLMETNNPELFDEWIKHWTDLVDFDIYPID